MGTLTSVLVLLCVRGSDELVRRLRCLVPKGKEHGGNYV